MPRGNPNKPCSIDGCGGSHFARGWCSRHYNRWVCHGDPLHVGTNARPAIDRFMQKAKINPETGCWEWQGHINRNTGYGTFRIGQEQRGPAHRRGWELLRGPVDPDLHLDHLCRVRHCVNPDHLEPVTPLENVRRAAAVVTHCPQGHEYDEANTYTDKRGRRACKTCHRASARRRYRERGGAQGQQERRRARLLRDARNASS